MAKPRPSHFLFGFLAVAAAIVSYVAYRTRSVSVPRRRWRRFRRPGTQPLSAAACESLQGLYTIEEGKDFFGETAVLKCSYTIERGQKIHHLSFFCSKAGTYFICEGRQHGDTILLNGHWRKAAANGAGLVRLLIHPGDGGADILYHDEQGTAFTFSGAFGNNNHRPHQPLRLRFCKALPANHSFEIIGHRGASRNVDFLPVSENSLAMMKMAARLGATGVEIDVRLTKDRVPVVFHDSFLSVHTVSGKLYGGLLHNYTLAELKRIPLRKGGRTPTLDECLHTILHKTPLRTVWLDIKKECDLAPIVALQKLYLQRAKAMGRELFIYIGIPDKGVLNCFTQLENYKDIQSLVELEPELALQTSANAWAPQYTSGFQRDKVAMIQAAGGKAFVWSLDSVFLIDLFMTKGGFDGLVTNSPPVAAHWYYTAGINQAKQTNTPSE